MRRAIARGRLAASVDTDGQIIDAELADREWEANTDLSRAPGAVVERAAARAGGSAAAPRVTTANSVAENNAAKTYWQARQAELDYLADAKELVLARDVDAQVRGVFLACRTKLLGIPSRARQALPHLSVADIGALEGLIREALEGLASEGTV